MRICLEEDLEPYRRIIGALSSSIIFGAIALLRLLDFEAAGVLFLEPLGRPRPRTLSRILERGALSSSFAARFATGCGLTSCPSACAAAAMETICGPMMGSDAAAAAAALAARLRGRLGARLDLRLDAGATGSALAARLDLRLAALLALADRATEVALGDRPPMTKCSGSLVGSASVVGSFEAFRLEGGLDLGLGGDSTTTIC